MLCGLIGILVLGIGFFIVVLLVLVGMFKYLCYVNNVELVVWVLCEFGYYLIVNFLFVVVLIGIFLVLIVILLVFLWLIYVFGCDGFLLFFLGYVDVKWVLN